MMTSESGEKTEIEKFDHGEDGDHAFPRYPFP